MSDRWFNMGLFVVVGIMMFGLSGFMWAAYSDIKNLNESIKPQAIITKCP